MKENLLTGLLLCLIYISSSGQGDTAASTMSGPPVREVLPPATIYASEPIPADRRVVYKINRAVSYPISIAGTAWSLYCFTRIYSKDLSPAEDVLALNKEDVPAFDRGLMYPYDDNLGSISYIPFYSAMPFPFLVFLTGKDMRNDFLRLSFIYWETMSVVGFFSPTAPLVVDKYRPYAYFNETHMDKRTGKVGRNSFYAGHAAVTGAGFFCAAKIYGDYYPDSGWKIPLYGLATAVTASVAIMRVKAGEHFLSDTILGTATGVLAGIFVPHFHKVKDRSSLGILPFTNEDATGLTLTYKFKDSRTALK